MATTNQSGSTTGVNLTGISGNISVGNVNASCGPINTIGNCTSPSNPGIAKNIDIYCLGIVIKPILTFIFVNKIRIFEYQKLKKYKIGIKVSF